MRYVLGLVLYGIADPWSQDSSATVLYTDGVLPTSGLPSEISGCTVRPILVGRPGLNWGADPRTPTGSNSEATVTLLDDADGTLATLWMTDPDATVYQVDAVRLAASTTSATLLGAPIPLTAGIYYLGNEAVSVTPVSVLSVSQSVTLTRGRCGSTARAHYVAPAEYSPGEDGSQDRILLRRKPDWSERFYCGLYLFELAPDGSISTYLLRRGIVPEEPAPGAWPRWEVKVRFLEDALADHQVGAASKEVTLSRRIVVEEFSGTDAAQLRPQKIGLYLKAKEAEEFFNEPLRLRGSDILNPALVSSLDARLKADPEVTYELAVKDGDSEWIFGITNVSISNTADYLGNLITKIRIAGELLPDGYSSGATIGVV